MQSRSLEVPREAPDQGSWRARLALAIGCTGDRSSIVERAHEGPLYVQRPFYPEGPEVPHVYLLHPPGGLVAGDRLHIDVEMRAKARALCTTPAAQKVYRSGGADAIQDVKLVLHRHARLEWLPTETIVFDGARARLRTEVQLGDDAALIAWDIGCFGRTASGEAFDHGALQSSFSIFRAGAPLLIETFRAEGGSELFASGWGYAGQPVYGSLYCVPAKPALAAVVNDRLRDVDLGSELHATTAMDGIVVVRCLASSCERARALLIRAWRALRPLVFEREAILPRVWAT